MTDTPKPEDKNSTARTLREWFDAIHAGGCLLDRTDQAEVLRAAADALEGRAALPELGERLTVMVNARLTVFNHMLAEFPEGHDIEGIYGKWKNDLLSALKIAELCTPATPVSAKAERMPSVTVHYQRAPEYDKRIGHGDDYAGDAFVRWVAVGQEPDDAHVVQDARSTSGALPESSFQRAMTRYAKASREADMYDEMSVAELQDVPDETLKAVSAEFIDATAHLAEEAESFALSART